MDELPGRPRRVYLEYVGGASSKFYAITLFEEVHGAWTVQFNFGRIGTPRHWAARVERVAWATAETSFLALLNGKKGKGYELRVWPAFLKVPDQATLGPAEGEAAVDIAEVLFRADRRGILPPEVGGAVAGVALPDGRLYSPSPDGGSRGEGPVIWASAAPVEDVHVLWSRLAAAFGTTGLWPVVVDATYGFTGYDDYLSDGPRGRHTEVLTILRRGWHDSVAFDDDDEYPEEEVAPFGKHFPGLASPTPGDRPVSLDEVVDTLHGHLAFVAVNRPADALDAVGWMGAVNSDAQPLDQTTVLRSWETRFDAYLVGLGTDTLTLAVGRPPVDLDSALAIAAEHFAFCPDSVQQGAGSIQALAEAILGQRAWWFWWD